MTMIVHHSTYWNSQHTSAQAPACFTELQYTLFFFLFWIKISFVLVGFHYLVYPFKILVYLKLTKHISFCLQMIFTSHEITKNIQFDCIHLFAY